MADDAPPPTTNGDAAAPTLPTDAPAQSPAASAPSPADAPAPPATDAPDAPAAPAAPTTNGAAATAAAPEPTPAPAPAPPTEDDDDDVPLASLVAKPAPAPADDDDDVPLSALVDAGEAKAAKRARRKAEKKAMLKAQKKEAKRAAKEAEKEQKRAAKLAKKQKKEASKPAKAKAAPSRSKSKPRAKPSAEPVTTIKTKPQERDLDDFETLKDQAIDGVLVRWNYTDIPWPPPYTPLEDSKYMELPGLPGVYIGVRDEATGVIEDRRDMSGGAPTYDYLSSLDSSRLRDMWTGAIEKQLDIITEKEGDASPMLAYLKAELRHARAFNADKADKQFKRTNKHTRGGEGAGTPAKRRRTDDA